MKRASQYDDNDDHHQTHDHIPLASSESSADATQPGAPSQSRAWTEQLATYLKVMARGKKQAASPEVVAYYKHQREVLKRLIEVHELQESAANEPNESRGENHNCLTTTTTATGAAAAAASAAASGAGATAGTPTSSSTPEEKPSTKSSSSLKNTTITTDNNNNNNNNQNDESSSSTSGALDVIKPDGDEDEEETASVAATLCLILNICLLGLKIYAALASGSLILLASLLDSVLDLVSGFILVVVEWKIASAKGDPEFPIGTHHWESIGTLAFSCFMFVASTRLIEDGATTLADISKSDASVTLPTLVVMGSVVFTKAVAFLLCRSSSSSMVLALADDHRNDVITNSIGLAGLFLTQHVSNYFDPSVSLLTCAWLLRVWGKNILEQARSLSGKMADKDYLNELTSLARNCDPRLVAVDTVRAVTSGSGYLVEIDLVLPPDMPLHEAHDIGEKFQMFLEAHETLGVARAYVHLDYETDHDPRRHQ